MIIQLRDYSTKGIQISGNGLAQGDSKEQICFDLHVGESIRIAGDDTRRPTPSPLRLKPNDCLRIETREHLTIPNTVFGMLCSRASLTAEGLVAANLKIDPKFQGKLTITIYNASKNIITINPDLPFCSIFFATLETAVENTSPVRTPPEAKIITGNRLVEWLHRHTPHIATFIFSVLASIIASWIFYLMTPQKPSKIPTIPVNQAAPVSIAPDPSMNYNSTNKNK
jgi:deoxycytidine triphosphate deaminase